MSERKPGPWTGKMPSDGKSNGKGIGWGLTFNKPGKGKNPITIEKRKAGLTKAAAARANAGPAGEAPKDVFSKGHVKKRHKKAITKAKKNYGTPGETAATYSGRASSAERAATPKRRVPKATRKRTNKMERLTSAAVVRTQKKKREKKQYKGKYFGPDEFKGNQNKINQWKLAGKPRTKSGKPKTKIS